jgi:pimeloyl-ACP methyl ester carboxylesterase
MLPEPQSLALSHGRLTFRESGRKDAAALVLLHGIGSTSVGWRGQYGPLGECFRVIAWNAPGYRDSDPLPGEAPSAGDYARVLAELLAQIDVAKMWIASNSWGTLIAIAMATLHPDRVRGLVLGGPTAGYSGLAEAERRQQAEARAERIRSLGPVRMRAEDAPRLVGPGASTELLDELKRGGDELTVEGYVQAARMLYATDAVPVIAKLAHPVLVISGAADIVTPPAANAERLAAAAENGRIESWPGIGHLPHLEDPARFNATVRTFTERHSGS